MKLKLLNKNTFKIIILFIIILFSSGVFANTPPNYPKGFSPKTTVALALPKTKGKYTIKIINHAPMFYLEVAMEILFFI